MISLFPDFFIFMNFLKRLTAAAVFIICFSILGSAQERTWKTYSPKHGGWSILAPGTMNADSEALKENSKQGSYSFHDYNGFFAVIYKDYGGFNFLPWKQGHFLKQRDLVVKSNKGTLISDKDSPREISPDEVR